MTETTPSRRSKLATLVWLYAGTTVLTLVYLAGLMATKGGIGMVWDEPPDIARQMAVHEWFQLLSSHPNEAFQLAELERGWPYAREAPDEHPPVASVAGMVCWRLTHLFLPPLDAHRSGHYLLFGLLTGGIFAFVFNRWGPIPAIAAACSFAFNPRAAGHAQLVTMDMPVAAASLLAAVAFLHGCESGKKLWLFGIALGLAIMTKATGLLVVFAMLLWALAFRIRHGFTALCWTAFATPLTMVLLHPGWWRDPVGGILRWINAMLQYPQKIPVHYFGVTYDARTSFPPWHNPWGLLITGVPTPILLGLCAAVTLLLASLVRKQLGKSNTTTEHASRVTDTAVAGWALSQLLIPMVLRMFSILPVHDGLRQIIMVMPPLAILVGFAVHRFLQSKAFVVRTLATIAVAAGTIYSAYESIRIHPYPLSYFNELVGGPAGAAKRGLEVTYYWDGLNDHTVRWINDQLPVGASVYIFPPPDVRIFHWYQRFGTLRDDLKFENFRNPHVPRILERLTQDSSAFLVMLHRKSHMPILGPKLAHVWNELAQGPAVYDGRPAQVGTRLIGIYDRSQFNEAVRKASEHFETSVP